MIIESKETQFKVNSRLKSGGIFFLCTYVVFPVQSGGHFTFCNFFVLSVISVISVISVLFIHTS